MSREAALQLPAGRFSDAYRVLAARTPRVCDSAAHFSAFGDAAKREAIVRRIWLEQRLDAEMLRTEDERPLHVLSPGWPNAEAGPDFLNAEFRLGQGHPRRADVEVHFLASGWLQHGHHCDPKYRSVGLHVCLFNDIREACVLTHDGTRVPQVALVKYLDETAEDLLEEGADTHQTAATEAPCSRVLARGGPGPEWLGRFLDAAGDERMLRKAQQCEHEREASTLDQVMYEATMEALGYKNNRVPFRRLARRLPLAEMRRFLPDTENVEEKQLRAEAMLLGVAGLLREVARPDEETAQYLAVARMHWQAVARDLGGRAMRAADWDFTATRPLNYPTRRIAAAAAMLARDLHQGLFRSLLRAVEASQSGTTSAARAARLLTSLQALFAPPPTGYWAHHCTLGGRPLARAHRLVGRERATAMAVNVVIPLLLSEARHRGDSQLETTVHELYAALPRLADNNRTRYVSGRMFASPALAATIVRTARRQQGLLQLYADCCNDATRTCGDCVLLAAMGAR